MMLRYWVHSLICVIGVIEVDVMAATAGIATEEKHTVWQPLALGHQHARSGVSAQGRFTYAEPTANVLQEFARLPLGRSFNALTKPAQSNVAGVSAVRMTAGLARTRPRAGLRPLIAGERSCMVGSVKSS